MPSTPSPGTGSVVIRLAAFGAGLVVAGLLGAGLGAAVGPIDVGGGRDEAPPASVPADDPAPTHDVHGGG